MTAYSPTAVVTNMMLAHPFPDWPTTNIYGNLTLHWYKLSKIIAGMRVQAANIGFSVFCGAVSVPRHLVAISFHPYVSTGNLTQYSPSSGLRAEKKCICEA